MMSATRSMPSATRSMSSRDEIDDVRDEIDAVRDEIDDVGDEIDGVRDDIDGVGEGIDPVGGDMNDVCDDIDRVSGRTGGLKPKSAACLAPTQRRPRHPPQKPASQPAFVNGGSNRPVRQLGFRSPPDPLLQLAEAGHRTANIIGPLDTFRHQTRYRL